MLEAGLNDVTLVIIVVGSIIGAIKANFGTDNNTPKCNRVANGLLSIFCGVLLAKQYSDNLTVWLSGLVALTTSMLSVSILDTLHIVTPKLVKIIVKLKIGIKDDL